MLLMYEEAIWLSELELVQAISIDRKYVNAYHFRAVARFGVGNHQSECHLRYKTCKMTKYKLLIRLQYRSP
jgi:hypothetical protein